VIDKKEQLYTQCKLCKGGVFQTSWIPASFAQVDRVLKIDGDDGWVVKETYATGPLPPQSASQMIRYHRKQTGDSLPKIKEE